MEKQIGLALGSGGGRGLAHIGVIKSLTQNNIPINFIAGSSIGAIVGGLYAAIGDIKELERIVDSLSFKSYLRSLFRKTPGKDSIFNKKFDSFFRNIVGEVNIEDLKIPYCAIGSSLATGKMVIINKGSLITAMKASSAIPIILKPVKIGDDYVFDGGMITPVPTEAVKQMGADIVIGVSLYGGIFPIKFNPKKNISKIKAGAISRFISLERLTNNDMEKADIKIDLNIPGEDYGIFSKFLKNQGIINYGFESTEKMMVEIKKYKI